MFRKFWLLFAQACTLCLAALFVVATLRPDLLPRFTQRVGNVVLMQQSAPTTPIDTGHNLTFADAAKKATISLMIQPAIRPISEPLRRRLYRGIVDFRLAIAIA